MKIGILTQPLISNYGGILQNYALQQVLIRAGYDVETIDWRRNYFRVYLSNLKQYIISYIRGKEKTFKRYQPNRSESLAIYQNTNYFIDKYIIHTLPAKSSKDFQKYSKLQHYDAYIVGSDQCWRPLYNPYLKDMFLNFTKGYNVRKLAYAASFGTDFWEYTEKETNMCSILAKQFNSISVREDSGVDLCEKYLKVKAEHVLDPTMLLLKEDYIRLIENENENKSEGTLFSYILDPNSQVDKLVRSIEDVTGLKSFDVLPKIRPENRYRNDVKQRIEECIFPSVTKWLRAFYDAEAIIVDSFHGMVFSIIFNKPFWVLVNNHRGASRFTSLLKMFNLESRLLNINEIDLSCLKNDIDWSGVNKIMKEKRSLSLNFLYTALTQEY